MLRERTFRDEASDRRHSACDDADVGVGVELAVDVDDAESAAQLE